MTVSEEEEAEEGEDGRRNGRDAAERERCCSATVNGSGQRQMLRSWAHRVERNDGEPTMQDEGEITH